MSLPLIAAPDSDNALPPADTLTRADHLPGNGPLSFPELSALGVLSANTFDPAQPDADYHWQAREIHQQADAEWLQYRGLVAADPAMIDPAECIFIPTPLCRDRARLTALS